MFDLINRLWHEMRSKLHHIDETKHHSYQHHEERVQNKNRLS